MMTAPEVVPQPQLATVDDKLAAFDNVPLFMKSLPADDTDASMINALQSLVYDGTPDEIALNFKEQGNDYFMGKRYREALGFYTQGVDANPNDLSLLEILLINRAACNLELMNFGSVLRDCSKALNINQKSSKAYYRSSLALMALGRVEEAIDCCDCCLAFDTGNKPVKMVRDRAARIKTEKDEKENERLERLRIEREQKLRMENAFQERNLIPIRNPNGAADNPYEPHFDLEDSTKATLVFPVFFLYPQYALSDIISNFVEDTPFSAHLAVMFPPRAPAPTWDKNGEYVDDQMVIYAMTHRKRLLKVGKKMTLKDTCHAAKEKDGELKDGLEIKEGCLTFVVLPKGGVERQWVDEYKRSRDI